MEKFKTWLTAYGFNENEQNEYLKKIGSIVSVISKNNDEEIVVELVRTLIVGEREIWSAKTLLDLSCFSLEKNEKWHTTDQIKRRIDSVFSQIGL